MPKSDYKKERVLERDETTVDVDTEGVVEIKNEAGNAVKLSKMELDFLSKITED